MALEAQLSEFLNAFDCLGGLIYEMLTHLAPR
jgi:hypothetical protein